MSSVQIVSWIATGILMIMGISMFTYNYLKGRKEILSRDYSQDTNTANLIKELYEMADIEDKDSIVDIVKNNIGDMYDFETTFSLEHAIVPETITPYSFYKGYETFNFIMSKELGKVFPKVNLIYTATKCSVNNYKITWQDDDGEYEKYYKESIVKEYLNNGQWLVIKGE